MNCGKREICRTGRQKEKRRRRTKRKGGEGEGWRGTMRGEHQPLNAAGHRACRRMMRCHRQT
ncbi:hypothetical protein [Methanovulcanius yangii]|uniref:hypothetical protein n=1 Tax=Methanovulcanius yangii TaxID=1789227 RepID=UPI0029CA56CA|nr:hypothetical protein [Methanovulcanius yangii]